MREFKVQLHSVQDVEEFVGIITTQPFRVRLGREPYQVDGREFMEMFCLDLNHPVSVAAECTQEEFERFRQECWAFLAK